MFLSQGLVYLSPNAFMMSISVGGIGGFRSAFRLSSTSGFKILLLLFFAYPTNFMDESLKLQPYSLATFLIFRLCWADPVKYSIAYPYYIWGYTFMSILRCICPSPGSMQMPMQVYDPDLLTRSLPRRSTRNFDFSRYFRMLVRIRQVESLRNGDATLFSLSFSLSFSMVMSTSTSPHIGLPLRYDPQASMISLLSGKITAAASLTT